VADVAPPSSSPPAPAYSRSNARNEYQRCWLLVPWLLDSLRRTILLRSLLLLLLLLLLLPPLLPLLLLPLLLLLLLRMRMITMLRHDPSKPVPSAR